MRLERVGGQVLEKELLEHHGIGSFNKVLIALEDTASC